MATNAMNERNSLKSNEKQIKPIISFGLITDIHYADNEDRWNYSKTFLRRYRNSLKLVSEACQHWTNEIYSISFVIQLGDLIDETCQNTGTSNIDLQVILKEFQRVSRIYHVWGNHELYNFTRNELLNGPLCSFDTKYISPGHYGTIEVCSHLRIIAIDTYELSLLGVDKNDELYIESMKLLRQYNKNENTNDPTGLEGEQQRFVKFNGGLTEKQLCWLKQQLVNAEDHHAKVIIVGHIPIHLKASDELALVWNYEKVLDVLWQHSNTVLAYIAGHSHEGGYYRDEKHIHHLTLRAIVECEPNTNAFASVHVYEEFLIIDGIGSIGTYRIDFTN